MSGRIFKSHIREGSNWPAVLISIGGHLLLVALFLFVFDTFSSEELIVLGSGPGGGQGAEYVTVGLSAAPSGGIGAYKPMLTPRPQVVPPPPPKVEPAPPAPDPNDFVEKASKRRSREEPLPKAKEPIPAPPEGRIPLRPEPGVGGPGGGSAGSGGGAGGGLGVSIGTGTGEGTLDSWYVRQVEQRIGGNWLKTSLGQLDRPVGSIVSFEVAPNGTIGSVRLEKASGITAVDLAAQRAVLASNPLPPLPYELRNKRLRFAAHFDYPPPR